MTIRHLVQADIPALQTLLSEISLFSPEMLPDIAVPALAGEEGHLFFVAEALGVPIALAYLRAEEMTEGVWNMLALGVSPSVQRSGHAARLVARCELALTDVGARLVLVDTSSTEDFAGARAFYAAQGYVERARIPDYWAPGDDKVTFTKAHA